tara:strand:- start:2977 stop:3135 length:159 start_codon:yes stop_codon:yes gene_type:complete
MSKKSSRGQSDHRDEFIDDFEDFGYKVKNIKRHSKKKIAKFKREKDEYYDSY